MLHFSRIAMPTPKYVGALLISTVSLLGMWACSDDDNPKIVPPVVSFTNLTADMEVHNTVTITLDASSDEGIASIAVSVDGTLITTLTDAPYSFEWDTNTVEDGTHTVTVVVTDADGNETTEEINITVVNTLVTLTVPDDFDALYEYYDKYYVFLSDDDGAVILTQECERGGTYTLKAPSFEGESFYLSEVLISTTYDYSDTESYGTLARNTNWTLSEIYGAWNDFFIDPDEDDLTTISVSTTHATDSYLGVSVGDDNYLSFSEDLSNTPVDVSTENPLLYLANTSQTPYTYAALTPSLVNANNFDLSDVTSECTTQIIDIPSSTTYVDDITLYGLTTAQDYVNKYNLGMYYSGSTVYYPGDTFADYALIAQWYGENVYVGTGTSDFSVIPTNFQEPKKSISITDGMITYTATAEGYAFAALTVDVDDHTWFYFVPLGEDQQVPVLALPDVLEDYNLTPLTDINLVEFQRYTGNLDNDYDAVIDYVSQSQYGPFLAMPGNINYSYLGYYIEQQSGDGRLAGGKLSKIHHAGR